MTGVTCLNTIEGKFTIFDKGDVYLLNKFIRIVRTMLSNSMDVMGMIILRRSVSIRISPGNLPNQLISQGAICSMVPIMINTNPAAISQRPMIHHM